MEIENLNQIKSIVSDKYHRIEDVVFSCNDITETFINKFRDEVKYLVDDDIALILNEYIDQLWTARTMFNESLDKVRNNLLSINQDVNNELTKIKNEEIN